MRLDVFSIEDVHDFDAVGFEIIRNQRAMTTPPDGFGAHDRDASAFTSKIEKTLDALMELLCFHVIGVTAK
jgi:hypothetical protein